MNSQLCYDPLNSYWSFITLLSFVFSPQQMLADLSKWFRNLTPTLGNKNKQVQNQNNNITGHHIHDLAWDMAQCLEQDKFHLNYQPQIEIKTGNLLGVETLIRWNHPRLGPISPADFIPIAEKTGLIVPMGYWVLKQSCLQYKKWRTFGIPPFKLSVNLSLRQLQEENLVPQIKKILEQTQMNSQELALEVTESLMLQQPGEAIKRLNQLHELGLQIAIDDFGVGYSSLSYLKDLPLHTLKIDKSFLDDLLTREKNQVILQSIIELGHRLALNIVAEGVESQEQLDMLNNMDCDYGQGYLFSRPLGLREATAFFQKSSFLKQLPLVSI